MQALESNLLDLWESMSELINLEKDQLQVCIQAISEFITHNSLALLQILTGYLRKELKIPQYSGMYDEELILKETEALFMENPHLLLKI